MGIPGNPSCHVLLCRNTIAESIFSFFCDANDASMYMNVISLHASKASFLNSIFDI